MAETEGISHIRDKTLEKLGKIDEDNALLIKKIDNLKNFKIGLQKELIKCEIQEEEK